jgi:hypothetical protein
MPLTLQVSKTSVTKQFEGCWLIGLKLVGLDGTTEVINQGFSVAYYKGQSGTENIATIQAEMQGYIDNYKAEQQILSSPVLAAAISQIQTNLKG